MGALKIEPISQRCAVCEAPVAISPVGRPRLYCSTRCKQKAVRNRRIIAQVAVQLQRFTSLPQTCGDDSEEEHRPA